MKQTRALEEQWETYGVEMETVGMVMLNLKHRSKSAYFAEQKRLRLRERRREGGVGEREWEEKRERDANWEHVQKKICVNGAGRQDYEGGEETFDELGLSMRERRDKNSIADKRITY